MFKIHWPNAFHGVRAIKDYFWLDPMGFLSFVNHTSELHTVPVQNYGQCCKKSWLAAMFIQVKLLLTFTYSGSHFIPQWSEEKKNGHAGFPDRSQLLARDNGVQRSFSWSTSKGHRALHIYDYFISMTCFAATFMWMDASQKRQDNSFQLSQTSLWWQAIRNKTRGWGSCCDVFEKKNDYKSKVLIS